MTVHGTKFIGWQPHELLWLEVAVKDGDDGLRQLAQMTCRTFSACKSKAYSAGYLPLEKPLAIVIAKRWALENRSDQPQHPRSAPPEAPHAERTRPPVCANAPAATSLESGETGNG